MLKFDEWICQPCHAVRWKWIARWSGIYLIPFLVYMLIWVVCGPYEQPDTPSYFEPARGLVSNGVYGTQLSNGEWVPTAYRTPGLPLVLAFFYYLFGEKSNTFVAASLLNVIVAPVLPITAFLIGRRFGKFTAWFAYLFVTFHASVMWMNCSIMSDLLFASFLAGGLILTSKALTAGSRKIAFAAGVVLGIATLFRPAGLYYIPIVLAFAFIANRVTARGLFAWLLAGFIITLAPWVIRNTMHYGRPVMDTLQGHAILWSITKLVEVNGSEPQHVKEAKAFIIKNREAPGQLPYYRGRDYRFTHDLKVSQTLAGIGKEIYRTKPFSVYRIWLANAINITVAQLHYDDLYHHAIQQPIYLEVRARLIKRVPTFDRKVYHFYLEIQRAMRASYTYIAWVGLTILFFRDRKLAFVFAVTIAYFTCLTALVSGYDRFRLVLEPFYAVIVALPFTTVASHLYALGQSVLQRPRSG